MSRPKNKSELLEISSNNYQALTNYVENLSLEELNMEFPEGFLNRNVRDVLAHLHHWHIMMLDWYEKGMKGDQPDMPARGYSWKTAPALNLSIREMYKDIPLKKVVKLLNTSYQEIQNIIRSHNDDELFTKKKYRWTGSTSLGAYLISASSSHYAWALKLVAKVHKSLRKTGAVIH